MATDVLIMGPPGSGKGTQAERLAKRRSLAHISTGDMLRAAMDAGSELGKQVKAIVERGDLVPDPLMLELVDERLRQPDAQPGFILDGFPRTVTQAEGLLELLERQRRRVHRHALEARDGGLQRADEESDELLLARRAERDHERLPSGPCHARHLPQAAREVRKEHDAEL